MLFLTHHNLTRTLLNFLFGGLLVISVLVPFGTATATDGDRTIASTMDQMISPDQCNFMDGWTSVNWDCLAAYAANTMLWVVGLFVTFAGALLNWALIKTVVGMGTYVNDMSGLVLAWTVLRDFANLVFIFALVFISIATILRVERYGYKQLLKNLIIVALLINFSLVITKAVIDTANLFASGIYTNILFQNSGDVTDCTVTIGGGAADSTCLSQGLSAIFMDMTRITTLYSSNQGLMAEIGFGKIIVVGFFGSIFLLVTGFIFLSAAILLLIRFVTLILVMIFSPLAFAAYILPQTQGYASKWWSTLLSQAFFAPFYLLLIWITVVLMTSSTAIVGDETLSFADALLSGDMDMTEILLNFLIITIFMIASLVVAQRMGAYGAGRLQGIGRSIAVGAGIRTSRLAGAATFGTLGYVGRGSIGRRGQKIANSEWLKDQEARGGMRGYLARQTMRAGNKAASSTYDARHVGGMGRKLNLGAGSSTTYNKAREQRAKDMQERAKRLGDVPLSTENRQKIRDNEIIMRNNSAQYEANMKEIAAHNQEVEKAKKAGDTARANRLEASFQTRRAQIKNENRPYTDAMKEIDNIKKQQKKRGDDRIAQFTTSLDRDAAGFVSGFLDTRDGYQDAVDQIRKGETEYDKLMKKLKDDLEKGNASGGATPPSSSNPNP